MTSNDLDETPLLDNDLRRIARSASTCLSTQRTPAAGCSTMPARSAGPPESAGENFVRLR